MHSLGFIKEHTQFLPGTLGVLMADNIVETCKNEMRASGAHSLA